MRETESAADDPAVAEYLLDFMGSGIRGNIKVLGLAAEQQVAHPSPHEIGIISLLFQLVEHPDGIWTDPLAGDRVFGTGNDRWFYWTHGTI
jgi:hypothetical protein